MRFASLSLLPVLALLASACATSGAVPRPFPGSARPPATAAAAPSVPEALVRTALGFRGVPYRSGGSDPGGFDCSGFVQYVFAQHGLALPREVRDQFGAGRAVDRDGIEPGDLVFFTTVAAGPSHVGLAIGDGQFVHAPSSRGVVRVERYTAPYWASRLVGVKRIGR